MAFPGSLSGSVPWVLRPTWRSGDSQRHRHRVATHPPPPGIPMTTKNAPLVPTFMRAFLGFLTSTATLAAGMVLMAAV